jgi:NADPH:quinone reductase
MRAYAIEEFGGQGTVRDMPMPQLEPGQICIRVDSAGVNPVDNAVLQGYLKDMLQHRFPLVPGIDASGTIEAVDEGVQGLVVGDPVFGTSGKGYFGAGTYAEYATMSHATVAHKPSSLTHEQAAAIPTAGVAALMLLDALQLERGQVVLAIGAVGGVGSYFVQLATQQGARVVAVSRSENEEYVRSLGAEDLIDYTTQDVGEAIAARHEEGVDAVADIVGDKDELSSALGHVKAGGRAASLMGAVDEEELKSRALGGQNVNAAVTTERLDVLASHLASGRLHSPDLETMPLDKASEALARLASRHTRGKLILKP